MSRPLILSLIFGFSVVVPSAQAAIHHVPQDVATIQGAMNIVADNDTILVAPGLYAEALYAPPLSFWLIGESNAEPCSLRAIVDPSQLEGSDTLACLVIPEGSLPTVENMCFHNREPMLNGRPGGRPGGILCSSSDVAMKNCHGDSLVWGFYSAHNAPYGVLRIDSCRFTNCINASVHFDSCLIATNSFFQADGYYNVTAWSHTTMSGCTLAASSAEHLGIFAGDSLRISDCAFGPDSTRYWAVELWTSSAQVENCTFRDIHSGYAVLGVWFDCGTDSVIVRDCEFSDNMTMPGWGGTAGITVGYYDDIPCGLTPAFLAERNSFHNLDGNVNPDAMFFSAPVRINNNSFRDSVNDEYYVGWSEFFTDAVLRNNYFTPELRACEGSAYGDARWNYWGDASGPFHPVLNPGGLGAEIGDNVDFIPWLGENPLNVTAPPIVATSYSILDCHPNPFNSSVTIEYALTREQDISIVIYDLLGREVETLFDQRQTIGIHRTNWNAENVASGIYIARLSSDDSQQSSQAVKLVLLK